MKWIITRDGQYRSGIYAVVQLGSLWAAKRRDVALGEFPSSTEALRAAARDYFARCVTSACGGNPDRVPDSRVAALTRAIETAGGAA